MNRPHFRHQISCAEMESRYFDAAQPSTARFWLYRFWLARGGLQRPCDHPGFAVVTGQPDRQGPLELLPCRCGVCNHRWTEARYALS